MNDTPSGTHAALNLAQRVSSGATSRRRKAAPAIVTPEDVLALQAKAMSEKRELQPAVMRELAAAGWTSYHTWNSQHSAPGFLDVQAFLETETDFWLLIAELKTETGKLTAAQGRWLDFWRGFAWAGNSATAFSEKILHATGFKTIRVEIHVWRPSDLLSGRIQEVIYKPTGAIIGARRRIGRESAS